MEITLTGRSRWSEPEKSGYLFPMPWRSSFAAGIRTVSCPKAAENRLSTYSCARLRDGDERARHSRGHGGVPRRSLDRRAAAGACAPHALPVPAPGISVLFGVPLIVISAQLALGYQRPGCLPVSPEGPFPDLLLRKSSIVYSRRCGGSSARRSWMVSRSDWPPGLPLSVSCPPSGRSRILTVLSRNAP
jgi:Exopolysaccharide synthesis, ExoD